ncbi:hypothetical protein BpHYR1_039967 [Brachionus plicatilis]|uniref:Uncharacterized protein n=1 Tax=Brachionus plicatilis TaxID=10195 RepID=A0A3M7SPF0_BRAPC|nr:hypothetical protein BpHYR1_039967 [Brachionus plicatilis]
MQKAHKTPVVAVVEKLAEIPNKYKKCSIEPKAKRGQKANAARALIKLQFIQIHLLVCIFSNKLIIFYRFFFTVTGLAI